MCVGVCVFVCVALLLPSISLGVEPSADGARRHPDAGAARARLPCAAVREIFEFHLI
jgi:hypothetical protein